MLLRTLRRSPGARRCFAPSRALSSTSEPPSTSSEPQPKQQQQQQQQQQVSKPQTTWGSVVVGEIIQFHAHPAADRLNVCLVDVGDRENPLQIICGAPNVREGARVPVATVGTRLAIADPESGETKLLKIKKSKLRGEVSQGMICSEAELGLADSSDGILILEDDAPVGSRVSEWSPIGARLAALEAREKEKQKVELAASEPADGDYRCHI